MPRAVLKVARREPFYKPDKDDDARTFERTSTYNFVRSACDGTGYLRETTVACASVGARHCVSIWTDFREGASRRFDSNPLTYGLTSA